MNEISIRNQHFYPAPDNPAQDSDELRYEFVAHYLDRYYRINSEPNCWRGKKIKSGKEASEEIQASRKKAVLVFMRQICDQTELDSRAVDQFMAAKSKDNELQCLVDFAIQLLREKRCIKDAVSVVDPLIEKKPQVHGFYFMPKTFKRFLERIVADSLTEIALECINTLDNQAYKDTLIYFLAMVLAKSNLNDQALEALEYLSDKSPLILITPQPVLQSFLKNKDLKSAVKLKRIFDPAKFNSDDKVQYDAEKQLGCIIYEISRQVDDPASDLKSIFKEYFAENMDSPKYFELHGQVLCNELLRHFYVKMQKSYTPSQTVVEKIPSGNGINFIEFTLPHFSKKDTLDCLMRVLSKKGLLDVIGNALSEIDGHTASELDLKSFKATKVYEALNAIHFFEQAMIKIRFSAAEEITPDDICEMLHLRTQPHS